jgi:hypothetical protein
MGSTSEAGGELTLAAKLTQDPAKNRPKPAKK